MDCKIDLIWDAEAAVWVATSEDVPGLVLESGSIDDLRERLCCAVPELLTLNCPGCAAPRSPSASLPAPS